CKTVEDHLNSVVEKIEEMISLRRFVLVNKTDQDAFGAYLHMDGRIGVLTHLAGSTDEEVARDISMHVAAINPTYISRDQVPEEEVNREREILNTQALGEGKPEKLVE